MFVLVTSNFSTAEVHLVDFGEIRTKCKTFKFSGASRPFHRESRSDDEYQTSPSSCDRNLSLHQTLGLVCTLTSPSSTPSSSPPSSSPPSSLSPSSSSPPSSWSWSLSIWSVRYLKSNWQKDPSLADDHLGAAIGFLFLYKYQYVPICTNMYQYVLIGTYSTNMYQ